MANYTKKFSELVQGDRPSVGGKCASLGELVSAGLPVPDGFAVTVDAFEHYRDDSTLREELKNLVQAVDATSAAALQAAHDKAVELVLNRPLPGTIEAEIRSADELWMTSSTKEIMAIVKLDGAPVGAGVPGPLAQRMDGLYQTFKQQVMRA